MSIKANAGIDQTVSEGSPVFLKGGGSSTVRVCMLLSV
jgi:hypothetical protein